MTLVLLVAHAGFASAAGIYFEVAYSASSEAGALRLPVTYTLWVPGDVPRLRGIIVHQHGCGFDANRGGETSAYDLHWQALAAKWDCALLGPAYKQTEQGVEGCRPWCDPRNGSDLAFLNAIDDLAGKCGHPELRSVPWCLWGHSGGAFWASLMQTLHPERIVAAWLRSGTAYPAWTSGEVPTPEISAEVYRIPTMLNPGIKESTDGRPIAAWLGSSAMFKDYREQHGAPIAFAADPLSGHDCGDSRYLAIPYFDACLALRLPDPAAADQTLRAVNTQGGYLAELMGRHRRARRGVQGSQKACGMVAGQSRRAGLDGIRADRSGRRRDAPGCADERHRRAPEQRRDGRRVERHGRFRERPSRIRHRARRKVPRASSRDADRQIRSTSVSNVVVPRHARSAAAVHELCRRDCGEGCRARLRRDRNQRRRTQISRRDGRARRRHTITNLGLQGTVECAR
ncbi:MAG: hypothetical protein QM775_27695 [Pirellulales bacterium]